MTDELMDARLRAAGERFRTANVDVAEARPDDAKQPRPRRHVPWTLLASAAVVVGALVAGLLLVGRGHSGREPSADKAALTNTVWRLASYGTEATARSFSTLRIAGGQLVADDSCSVLTAKARADGDRIRFSNLDVRWRGCTDSVGDGPQFSTGLDLFKATTSWSVHGDRLTLTKGATTAHLLVSDLAAPSADVPTATSTDWRLVSVTDSHNVQHLVDSDANARLRISGGRFTASDTCNTLSGRASGATTEFVLSDVSTTEIGCPGQSVAPVVDQVLSGKVSAAVSGVSLILAKPGAGTLVYVWVPADTAATDPGSIYGVTWRLASVAGDTATIDATLRIEQNATLTGNDGCHNFTGSGRVSPGVFTLTGPSRNPGTTCPAQTSTLDSFLVQPDTFWRVVGGKLTVFGTGAQAFGLVFTATDAKAPAPLISGRWMLTTIGKGSSATQAEYEDQLFLDADGGLRLYQCTSESDATWQTVGTTLKVDGAATGATVSGCTLTDKAFEQQENDVRATVAGSPRWAISDGQLHLVLGTIELIFTRR